MFGRKKLEEKIEKIERQLKELIEEKEEREETERVEKRAKEKEQWIKKHAIEGIVADVQPIYSVGEYSTTSYLKVVLEDGRVLPCDCPLEPLKIGGKYKFGKWKYDYFYVVIEKVV